MTQSKNTKRAWIASMLSLVLCFTMLIGSTFAWFTDSATTGVNTIQAGNLKVDLVDAEGKSLVGKTLTFMTVDNREADDILWEPGCRYKLPEVYVKNSGNLALTFQIKITGIQGPAKLNEVIEWNIELPDGGKLLPNHTSDAITIEGHMLESAGNEYRNLTIDGISITVYATQVSEENDSFNNTYDEKAAEEYEDFQDASTKEPYVIDKEKRVIVINTAAAFKDLAQGSAAFGLDVNDYPDSYTLKLGGNLSLGGSTIYEPIEAWWGNIDGCGYTISDINVNTNDAWAGLFKPKASESTLNIKNLKLDAINITSTNSEGSAGVVAGYSANAVLKDITVTNSSVSGAKRMGGIIGQLNGTISGCTVKNTVLTGGKYVGGVVGDLFAEGADASISDCHVDTITITSTANAVGSIVGRLRQPYGTATLTASTCTATDVTGATAMYGVNLEGVCTIN